MQNAPGAGELGPLATTDDECLVLDLAGRVVDANDAACRVLQRARDEVVGRAFWELCTCLTRDGFERRVAALRAEGPQGLLGHMRRPDGTLVPTETRLWLAPHGGAERVFALARELRGVQGVAEERDRLAHLVAASSELVVQLDRELRVTYANPAALERLGIARQEDAQGLALHELVAPAARDAVESRVVPRLLAHGRWEGELDLRSWSDAERVTPCSVHAFAVRDTRTQERVGFALAARDVGALRATETRRVRLLALAELSRRVAHLLLASDDLNAAIFEILAGAGRALGVTRAMVGRYREDGRWVLRTHEWSLAGGCLHRKEARAEPEMDYRWTTEILQRGEAVRIDGSTPPGTTLLAPGERALLALPVTIRGELAHLFAFACERAVRWEDDEVAAVQLMVDSFARGVERRIAERERAQALRELQQAIEREKQASRYKSEFLASMSHELRTPMTAIRGYAELLGQPDAARELQAVWVQNLRRSTEYLLALVHDVLDLSKIEAGRMQVARERTDLACLFAALEDLFGGQAREKGLELSVALETELPETITSDPVRLRQILVNLTGNALKFTAAGSVRVRARAIAGDDGARTLEVRVTDTGPGIPDHALGRLFQPFVQVHDSTGGTGLGLQIARSLARLLGGDVTVASRVGAGSTFTLSLPAHDASGVLRALPARGAAAAGEPRVLRAPPELAGKRVLVVDDSAENREVLSFLLREAGMQCEVERNGQSAVARALTAGRVGAPFDAILMDMNMPVMDGFEATKKLVAAGVTTPVIALTALAMAGDEERCRLAGCADYVAKPVMPALLLDTLARHVRLAMPAAAGDAPGAEAPAGPKAGNVISLAQHPRFRGLVERYLASFPELVERLRALERADRLDEVRTLAHRLRGTAASYGFADLAQRAGRCEDAIRAGAARTEVSAALDALVHGLTLARAG